MKIVYASRTGNVESFTAKLGLECTALVDDLVVDESFVLITYTDGYGDVPFEVETFLPNNSQHLKGVIASGDVNYNETYCKAGDVIASEYNVPCLYKFENDGNDQDVENVLEIISKL